MLARAFRASLFAAAGVCSLLSLAAPAVAAEPWSDAVPASTPRRYPVGDYGFYGGVEYRANALAIRPLSINGASGADASWIEHRLRLDAVGDWMEKVKVVLSADVLDGTLWGDNGSLGSVPESNIGTNIGAKNPNVARPCITQLGADALDRESYGYGLCSQQGISIRRAYGEVLLPFGLLRVGRQPVNIGTGVQNADGDGRANRFGFARTGSLVDRVLFATKPLEAFKPENKREKSDKRGLILALAYDRLVTDSPQDSSQNVQQLGLALRFLQPEHVLGRDLVISSYIVQRFDKQYGSHVNSFGLRAMNRFGDLSAGFDMAFNFGKTREVSEAISLITHDPVVSQTVRQIGARAVIRFDRPLWTAYLEADYASGDDDPGPRSALTGFVFAEDTNVGLLLFKHVLAYQTGRAAAAGTETLRRLGARSYPVDAIDTRGAFTNAAAIFPQFDLHPLPALLIRAGVLMAWAPAKVLDPIASLQGHDGYPPQLINAVGGKPGRYYGTELDLRVQWRLEEHFMLDLEGAILYPGDALQDENGKATRSTLVQVRTTFVL